MLVLAMEGNDYTKYVFMTLPISDISEIVMYESALISASGLCLSIASTTVNVTAACMLFLTAWMSVVLDHCVKRLACMRRCWHLIQLH